MYRTYCAFACCVNIHAFERRVLPLQRAAQVTDLAGAEAAVTRVEDSIRAAAADITAAWTGELEAQCEISDPSAPSLNLFSQVVLY